LFNSNTEYGQTELQQQVTRARLLEAPVPFNLRSGRDWLFVVMVFAAALIIRLLFFYLNAHNNPAHDFPIMDSQYHHEWALSIISGNFWGNEVFLRAPLYPYLLALLYKISGTSITFAVFIQHLMGSVTCIFVYLLASEFYCRRVSLVAGLLAAAYWPFIFFEGELLIVTIVLFLNTLFLLLLIKSLKRSDIRILFICGLVLGLSAIARPNILIFIPVIPLCFYFLRNSEDRPPGVHWLMRSLLLVLFCFLVILPVVIRNYRVGGVVVPIASSAGVNFYIGNNPVSDGRTAIVPGTIAPWWGGNEEVIAIAEHATGKKLNPSQVSNYYFRQGLDFIKSRPGQAARLFFKKLRMFWTSEERSNDKFIYFFWNLSGMGKIPLPGFWLIAPLALLGMVIQWRRRRDLSILFLFITMYMVGVIAFFINARFRLPVLPVLLIFASFSLFHLITACRENKKLFAYSALIVAVLALAVNYDFFTIRKTRPKHLVISHYTLGSAYVQKNEKEKALAQYELAYRKYKEQPNKSYELIAREVSCKLGALYWEKGECLKTISALKYIEGTDEQSIASMGFLGDCYFKTGQFGSAIKTFARILDIRPDYLPALNGIVQTLVTSGEFDSAVQVLEHAREHFPADDPRLDAIAKEIERIRATME
jgi:4-amino-4-deoxy-L-arabinose transferase-like glycosyltransferase